MKSVLPSAALLAVIAATPALADGWRGDGLYGSVKGGWTKPENQDFDNIGTEVEFDDGWTGSAAIGAKHGNMRVELEGLHQEANVKSVNTNGVATGPGDETKLTAAMVNGYYDFKNSSYWTPYVGVGAGYGRVKANSYNPAGGANAIDDDDGVLAYQGMAGVAYEFNPCWSFTGEYRYVGSTDADLTTAGGTNVNTRYQSHNLLAGVRYTF